MKPQHALWSSVKHCAFCWVLPQHFIKNNCHDDETDDDVKRFLDFSKVSRCRSELLPGRGLDAWNCVPLHLLTLNHRKKYLLSITSLPIYWTCFVKWTFHSWCLENMPLTHFFSIFFPLWYLFVFVEHTSHPKPSSKHWTSLIYRNAFCSTNTYCTCLETLSFTNQV